MGAYRVGLLMWDVELVDVGPEHGFCHFETSALGAGGTEGSFHFLSATPKEDFLKFHTAQNFTSTFSRCSPFGYLNPS